MCFGTEASFIAAGVLSTIGMMSLKLKKPKKYLPLALTPFIFAIQQAVIGVVWLSFGSSYLQLFSYFYLFIALFFGRFGFRLHL